MTNRKKATAEVIEPEFISVDEAQLLTGISRWTWRSYAYSGKIGSIKIGTRLLLPISEIRRFLNAGYRAPLDDNGKKMKAAS